MTLTNTLSSIAARSRSVARGPGQAPDGPTEEETRQTAIRTAVRGDIVAGVETRTSGILVDWQGTGISPGNITRQTMIDVLAAADCPVEWAPEAKSDVAHAGQAVSAATGSREWDGKRAPSVSRDDTGEREYRAHWVITRMTDGLIRRIGQEAGTIVVTATLADGSSELLVESVESPEANALASQIRAGYLAATSEQELTNGEVTTWIRSLLVTRLGAARCGRMSFVPAENTEAAERLVHTLRGVFGTAWLVIPVTDSAGLATAIAENYMDEITGLSRSWFASKEAAALKGKLPQAGTARTLLKKLQDLDSRAEAYRPLCADGELDATIKGMRALIDECQELLGAVAVRFALLDLSPDAPDEETDHSASMGIAGRGADEALAQRRAAGRLPADWMPPGLSPEMRDACLPEMVHPDRIHPRPEYAADWV